jgi:hypothetical protein
MPDLFVKTCIDQRMAAELDRFDRTHCSGHQCVNSVVFACWTRHKHTLNGLKNWVASGQLHSFLKLLGDLVRRMHLHELRRLRHEADRGRRSDGIGGGTVATSKGEYSAAKNGGIAGRRSARYGKLTVSSFRRFPQRPIALST